MDDEPTGNAAWDAFGTYLRAQRHLAQLSLRQLAELTKVSNPYLSQIERGLHQPSITIIKSLAEALNLSVSDLLAQAADIASDDEPSTTTTEGAIRNDALLNDAQKSALLAVYRSMVDTAPPEATSTAKAAPAPAPAPAPGAPSKSGQRRTRTPTRPPSTPPADPTG